MLSEINEYVDMCRKADEIQSKWIPKEGDCVSVVWKEGSGSAGLTHCILQQEPVYGLAYKDGEFWHYNGKLDRIHVRMKLKNDKDYEKTVYTPTQKQIQNLLCTYYQGNSKIEGLRWGDSINLFMIQQFYAFAIRHMKIIYDMDCLWFAFLMEEIYNKNWCKRRWW